MASRNAVHLSIAGRAELYQESGFYLWKSDLFCPCNSAPSRRVDDQRGAAQGSDYLSTRGIHPGKNHRLFDDLSGDEHQALETASRALRKLARASETAKAVQACREAEEKKALEREERDRRERLFQAIIAQVFDQDTGLLRCEALEASIVQRRGIGDGLAADAARFRQDQSDRSWSRLKHQVGQTLDQDMWGELSVEGYHSYWPQCKAGLALSACDQPGAGSSPQRDHPDE